MSSPEIPSIVQSIQRGIRWLKESAEGLSDTRDIAIAISALVAAERNPNSHLVQRLGSLLINRQSINGSWSDELWDTVWAAKALNDSGHGTNHKAIASAFRFLEATQDPFTGTWYEEPFETMLVLDLVARLEPDKIAVFSDRPISWVASLQKSDGGV